MKVFIAGATGVLGTSAVAALIASGHRVTGGARGDEKASALRELGAEPVSVDLFDPASLSSAVEGHDVVCNFATRIPRASYFLKSAWNENDRLHRDLSRLLVEASLEAGARRYLQHSVAFMYADGGDRWLDEDSPLEIPPHGEAVLRAEENARSFTESGGAGIAMRFGFFYGPGVPSARDIVRMSRALILAFPGRADAYMPLIHVDDLGSTVVAALDVPAGTYNVTDDDPLTRSELGDAIARGRGRTKGLRPAPHLITKVMGKRYDYMSRSQRVSNARFKEAAGWTPKVPSSRDAWGSVVKS
jgi:nucleoside-diphosphate-sugar epimerase